MFLVLIETSGNQNFIFSTNKLKENIGASELTYKATTEWLFQAVGEVANSQLYEAWQKQQDLKILANSKINPFIEQSGTQVEILLATSGKAILLTKEEKIAKAIIHHLTRYALIEAPGLDIGGVFVEFDWDKPKHSGSISIAEAVQDAHKKFEKVRAYRPAPNSRFLRLPITAGCNISELPASVVEPSPDNEKIPLSKVSKVKRDALPTAKKRLQAITPRLMPDINKLEKSFEISWLAVVHADGNGLGQILLDFQKYIGEKSNRNYIDKYRKFSLALDECTLNSFKQALEEVFPQDNKLPIVPLILGGDDLTVVCDGQYALEFTRVFLQKFEVQTQNHADISEIAQKVFGVGRLSACAGISIIKQHFPFSVAYDLAEKLIKSAKKTKNKVQCKSSKTIKSNTPFPCSAIDFHILYESSGVDFDTIRKKLEPESQTKLYNRPYVVTAIDALNHAIGQDWAQAHHWQKLADRVQWLRNKDDKDSLPNSQSHAIRTSLFMGQKEADSQYALIQTRYSILENFTEDNAKKSLFHQEEGVNITSFLDALDAKDFLKNANSAQLNGGKS